MKMTTYDAAKVLGLTGSINPDMTAKAYKQAVFKYHPDRNPAGEAMMKAVNAAFETLKNFSGDVKEQDTSYGDQFNDALNAIINLQYDLVIEICGAWIWVSGNTRPHKDALKTAGYRWASKKKMWHFRPAAYKSRSRGATTMDEIRARYGVKKPTGTGSYRLSA